METSSSLSIATLIKASIGIIILGVWVYKKFFSPLAWVKNDNVKKLSHFLKKHPEYITSPYKNKEPFIHYAAARGSTEVIKYLLEQGCPVDLKHDYEEEEGDATPLHAAVLNQEIEAVKLLIKKKANVNALTRSDLSPLNWAQAVEDEAIYDLLLKAGADKSHVPSSYEQDDDQFVSYRQEDDALMAKTVEQAQANIDELKKLFINHKQDTSIKFKFLTNENVIEHIWANVTKIEGDQFYGTIVTPPVNHKGRLEKKQVIAQKDIEDWVVEVDEKTVRGGYSIQVAMINDKGKTTKRAQMLEEQAHRYVDHDIPALIKNEQ
ncbi:MAG TPA: ankyrin repeat domain-containing protein [Oligoflexia bacterium]|nr:ankyrin repeat domain-containing protein [Oligoflexia bacterium]HMR25071.1 ankyrin repeat domain-containing protein [Oligoflexia bacterium]